MESLISNTRQNVLHTCESFGEFIHLELEEIYTQHCIFDLVLVIKDVEFQMVYQL